MGEVTSFCNGFIDVEKRGGTGTAVEIFICAADGEINITFVEFDRHRARGMTQIPQHERAFAMREFGDVCHVVKITAFECDMRKRDEGGLFIDGSFERGEIGCDVIILCTNSNYFVVPYWPSPKWGRDKSLTIPCRMYKSDGKFNVSVMMRFFSGCKVKRGGGEFEQVDGGLVADNNLTLRRAE